MATSIPQGIGPVPAVAGSIRFNYSKQTLEVYNAAGWQPLAHSITPRTWREWLDYYSAETTDHACMDDKLRYILNKMLERYPGPYVIKNVGNGQFDLDFSTPADATWWRLKYD